MPANGTGYYQLLSPVPVGSQAGLDSSYLAVNYGVKTIQRRINGLNYPTPLVIDGVFETKTDVALRWAQKKVGVVVDGQAGPKTMVAMLWPRVKINAGVNAHTVGGICTHESSWDPGAVGFSTPDDHGLVQINAPANPSISIAQAFDHNFAFKYCADRIASALAAYHNLDIAICSYASPLWAQQWFETGHSPNQAMTDYANYVKAWVAPS